MAVVGTAQAIGPGRPGDEEEDGLKIFQRTYLVRTDSPYDGPNVVLQATGLPAMGAAYVGHPTAVVVGRHPTPLPNTRLAWHVVVEWSTHSIDRDENPLLTKPEIEWGWEPFDVPIVGSMKPGRPVDAPDPVASSDENGNPKMVSATTFFWGSGLLNRAGDPFDPPPTRTDYYPVVRFTRNEDNFDAQRAIQYGNTVNYSSWNGLLSRQAWLKPIEASNMVQYAAGIDQPDIMYWRVRYTFVLKAETWDLQILNIGPNYLDVANTSTSPRPKKFPFLRGGYPVMDLLKEDGTRYADTEEKKPYWIRWPQFREVDFSGLGINLNLPLNEIRRKPRRTA